MEDNELAEDFAALREHNRTANREARDRRTASLLSLEPEGFTIRRITPYQCRVNGRLDIYPTHGKWHDIKTGKRGNFHGLTTSAFVREFFSHTKEKA